MKKRLAHIPRYILFVPLIIFVILLYGGILQRFVPAVSVGTTKYTAAQFNYWYFEGYLDYVDTHYDELETLGLDTSRALDKQSMDENQTWEDYFRVLAEDRLQETEALLALADEYGISLTAEDLPEYSQRLAEADAECAESGSSLDDLVRSYYGYTMTVANYKNQLLRETGADAVLNAVTASLEPSQTDIEAYTASHPELDDYNTANIRLIWFSPATDRFTNETGDTQILDMLAKTQLLLERWNEAGGDEDAFAELARRYSEHESASNGGEIDGVLKGELCEELDDWLSSSERQSGDFTTNVTADGIWVVYYRGAGTSAAEIAARQALLDERVKAFLTEQKQSYSVKERFGMRIAMGG